MKRYLTGIIAVVIAVSAFAFTKPENKVKSAFATTFYYEPLTYGSSSVANEDNWKSNITPPASCAFDQNKACQFDVADAYTHLDGSQRVLNTSTSQGSVLNIATMLGSNGTDYVPNPSTAGISNIVNKP